MSGPVWDFTVFSGDDKTPWFGTADANGNVVTPDFTTDPVGARPWLRQVPAFSASEIDFPSGSSRIGGIAVELLDKRWGTSQQTGTITSRLDEVIGHRAVLRRKVGSSMLVAFDGVIHGYQLLDDIVGYSFELRDPRAREQASLFSQNDTAAVFPELGPADPYGKLPDGSYLVPAAASYTGQASTSGPGFWGLPNPFFFTHYRFVSVTVPVPEEVSALAFPAYGTLIGYGDAEGLSVPTWFYPDVTVRWKPLLAPGAPWKYLRNMPGVTTQPVISAFNTAGVFIPGVEASFTLYMGSFDPADLPGNGQAITLQVLSARTTEATPFWWDSGSFGELLRDIYDGKFSQIPPRIRYNPDDMDAFADSTPPARMRVKTPAPSMREWVEENIYAPLGYAPGFDASMRIRPVSWYYPEDLDNLPTLTPDIIVPVGEWADSADNAHNRVEFKYIRENLFLVDKVIDGKTVQVAELVEQDVERVRVKLDSVSRIGEKTLSYSPITVRSTGVVETRTISGETQDNLGDQLADAISETVMERFGLSNATYDATVRTSETGDITLGDWVWLEADWLPSIQTEGLPWDGEDSYLPSDPSNPSGPVERVPNAFPVRIIEGNSAFTVPVAVTIRPTGYASRLLTRDAVSNSLDFKVPLGVTLEIEVGFQIEDSTVTSQLAVYGVVDEDLSTYTPSTSSTWIPLARYSKVQNPQTYFGVRPGQMEVSGLILTGDYYSGDSFTGNNVPYVKGLVIYVTNHGQPV